MAINYRKYFELVFWLFSITMLAVMPTDTSTHYSICIFKLVGLNFCPGCGLGHAISYLFHGNIKASFAAHPLGIFAVIVIILRIIKLFQLRIF